MLSEKLHRAKLPPYTYLKGDIYYFIRHVPNDLQKYYYRTKIVKSLRTKSAKDAKYSALVLAGKLDSYWLGLRLKDTEVPCPELIIGQAKQNSNALPSLSDCVELYLSVKGHNKAAMFFTTTRRNTDYLIQCLGNRPLDHYTTADAAQLRQWLITKGLSNSSVQRTFSVIKACLNFAIAEMGLAINNPFTGVYLPSATDKKKRHPIKPDQLKILQKACYKLDDDIRHLIALISDTGLRLAEAAGLLHEDIILDCEHPHVLIRPHSHRPLKTLSSNRVVPLVGASLWAAQRIKARQESRHCFPRYSCDQGCSSNSASAALNKWIKTVAGSNALVHGMRHALRDRMRAVEAPTDLIDQLGGWSLQSVGQGYGDGYSLEILSKWLHKAL